VGGTRERPEVLNGGVRRLEVYNANMWLLSCIYGKAIDMEFEWMYALAT
jgi:hypothetical protein